MRKRPSKEEKSFLGGAFLGRIPPPNAGGTCRGRNPTVEVMGGKDAHLNELGEFLKARRAELSPRTVGLPETRALRRVPGLRREEVAQLAAISTDYYTRLEQGRLPASASVLATLARVLRLDDDQRAYLYELAGKDTVRPRRAARKILPQMRRLLDQLTETPAMVLGRRMDILAWNPLAAALFTDFSKIPEKQRNYVRMVFTDPAMRRLYDDWETIACTAVAILRMEAAAQYPDDLRLSALVGELSVQDPDFRRWWAAHHVAINRAGTKTLHHPVVGEIILDWDTLTCAADPDQHLVIFTAEPGTPSHQALRFLASWATGPHQPSS
jgi:transcriptional regulator with XRE-family HTH domain